MRRGGRHWGWLIVVGTLMLAPAARADDGNGPDWLQPAVSTGILAVSLYSGALLISQVTRLAIVTAAPVAWAGTLQTFAVPAAMVGVMSQLIPSMRVSVPAMVNRWFDGPEVAERLRPASGAAVRSGNAS